MINFPKTHKLLPLPFPKELVFPADQEARWKREVEAFVQANKDDPKLVGYCFQHDGETTFWLDQWKEMAACQRKVADWVRAKDPNHVVLGASWLFGHGALKPELAPLFDYLDVIDVEPGLTWTPDSHGFRRAARRPVSIIAGLECYYFQPTALLRWRAYEALRQGANGIGICPSGMLAPKPETVSFLRGLYGEVAGLAPMLAGTAPKTAVRCDAEGIAVWERENGGDRYVVAMRGGEATGPAPITASFAIPTPARHAGVRFEGRTIEVVGRKFQDRFEGPYAVHVYQIVQ
jgi:hypothetical protein